MLYSQVKGTKCKGTNDLSLRVPLHRKRKGLVLFFFMSVPWTDGNTPIFILFYFFYHEKCFEIFHMKSFIYYYVLFISFIYSALCDDDKLLNFFIDSIGFT